MSHNEETDLIYKKTRYLITIFGNTLYALIINRSDLLLVLIHESLKQTNLQSSIFQKKKSSNYVQLKTVLKLSE